MLGYKTKVLYSQIERFVFVVDQGAASTEFENSRQGRRHPFQEKKDVLSKKNFGLFLISLFQRTISMSTAIPTNTVTARANVSPEWLNAHSKKGWLPTPILKSYSTGGGRTAWWPKETLSQISFIKTLRSCGKSTSEIHNILKENGMLFTNTRKEKNKC